MARSSLKDLTRALVMSFAVAALAAGCGESGPSLVTVTGTVTENGEPLANAPVMFTPSGVGDERTAEDVTGPQGNFKLMTAGRSGVIPGKYNVVITKGLPPVSAEASSLHPDDPFMAALSNPPKATKKGSKPTDYSYPREVTADSKQVFDFDLKSADAVEKPAKGK